MGCFKKNNRWYIDYYENGKRKREVVTIPEKDPAIITLRDAESALNIRKAEIATGKFDITKTEKPIKFEKLVDAYLEWAYENHKAPERDHAACKNLLYHFRQKNVYTMSLWDVESYKSFRKKQDRKPETINKELGVLRRMCNLAVQGVLRVKLGRNPMQGLKLLKVPGRKYRVYKYWEFQALYDAAPDNFRPILLCAFMTGMRRSEISKLKWEDVDLEKGYIHVVETKTDDSRMIPINQFLLNTLKHMKMTSVSEFVFTTPQGKSYTSNTTWKTVWTATLKRSGIQKGRFHDFRHTFCSALIVDEKEDYITVMGLSGHKDIRMLKRYSHTHEDAKQAAIQKLGKDLKLTNMDTYLDTKAGNDDQERVGNISISNLND